MNTRNAMTGKIKCKAVGLLRPGDFIHPTASDRAGGLVLKIEEGINAAKRVTLANRISKVRYEHGEFVQVTEQLMTGKALKAQEKKHSRWLVERELLRLNT